jgi:hypothetical protein
VYSEREETETEYIGEYGDNPKEAVCFVFTRLEVLFLFF